MHITLRFLGDTPSGLIAQIAEALHHVAADCPPFSFRIKGCGTFGSTRQAHVIWLGINNAASLISLSEKVNTQLFTLTTTFHLIESILKPSGPVYNILHTFELGEGHRA